MTPTSTQKGETLAGFGRQSEGFKSATHKGFATIKCATTGRVRQALAMLTHAGAKGLTQAEALTMDPTCWRLSDSVFRLRNMGFSIASNPFPTGRGGRAARYVLKGHCSNSMVEEQQ